MLIPKSIFGISNVASKDLIRPNACGVRLERNEYGVPFAVAISSSIMVAASWKEFAPEEWPSGKDNSVSTHVDKFEATVATDHWEEIGKAIPKRSHLPILSNALIEEFPWAEQEGDVVARTTNLKVVRSIAQKEVTGTFPYWRDVFRNAAGGITGNKNTSVSVFATTIDSLISTLQTMKAVAGKSDYGGREVCISIDGTTKPMRLDLLSSNREIGVSAVVMPSSKPALITNAMDTVALSLEEEPLPDLDDATEDS